MPETALITGASGGIGRDLAKVMARNGHNLLIAARKTDLLNELKEEIEGEFDVDVLCFSIDLSEKEAPKELFDFTRRNDLNVNILVNNAGIGDYGLFHESDWEKQQTMMDLNIKSLTQLTHLFLPDLLKQKRGYILNMASTAAFQPGPLMSVYYASKHYVLAFGEALANELKGTGVTVTTLCPGPTRTEFQSRANMRKSRLLDLLPMASSTHVAEYGYKVMKKGKVVAVYGVLNKIYPKFASFIPRSIVTSVVRKIQERK